jgi:hypothetical protein
MFLLLFYQPALGYPATMRISDERARELAEIHEEEFGEKLSIEEARAKGSRLVALYLKLMEPLLGERDQQDDS